MSWTTGVRRSWSFFVVLLFVVGPVYATTPFAWAFVLYTIWTGVVGSYTPTLKAVFLWAVLEVIFSFYHNSLTRRVTTTPPTPPADPHFLQALLSRVLKAGLTILPTHDGEPSYTVDTSQDEEQDAKERGSVPGLGSPSEDMPQLDFNDPRAQSFREYMRNWFHKMPWSEIHTHEMRQWVYWTTFNAHLPPDSKLSPAHRAVLDETLVMIQKRAGAVIKPGSNIRCKPLLLTLDPIAIHLRPLSFYASTWALNHWICWSFRRHLGFMYDKCGNLEYLVRIPQRNGTLPTPRPLVFMHGLGLGLLQYHRQLRYLLQTLPSHPILIPLQPHASQNIFHPRFLDPLPPEESVRLLKEVIRRMGWETSGVNMLSHSIGSIFHAWMLKSYPGLIKRSCFADPVSLCLWEGDLCYNFHYRPCLTGRELMMRYFVSSELGVANVTRRHFDWSANLLWFEEIPQALDPYKAAFFLGGLDDIINSERLKLYLRSQGVRKGLWFDPLGRHGQALMGGSDGMQQLVTWLLAETESLPDLQ